MIQTVPKNSLKAKAAIKAATNIRCYSLSNHFSGEPLAAKPVIWGGPIINNQYRDLVEVTQAEFLHRELYQFRGKLSESNGHYTLHVHSNLWYEFELAGGAQ